MISPLNDFRNLSATASAISKAETDSSLLSTVSSSPREINEHFFLPNPDELIYSHFPYDEVIISAPIFPCQVEAYVLNPPRCSKMAYYSFVG